MSTIGARFIACGATAADEQLAAALDAAGLVLLDRYDGYTDRPVGPQTERVLYVARKRA